jgi:hypothetical protein
MNDPHPTKRARRIEMRRKELGADRCFYCPESDLACLEVEHPVSRELDPYFVRAGCRNCHRKLEFKRDLKKLTNNGHRTRPQSSLERLRRYLLLLAEDQGSIADSLDSPHSSIPLVQNALRATAASLRRTGRNPLKIDYSGTRPHVTRSQRLRTKRK